MAQQTINVGASPNDGTGTPLRTAFQYTNSNFSELYTAVGPSGNNIVCPGSATITGNLTVDTNTFFVDSANNRVGVGTASPQQNLHVFGTGTQTIAVERDGATIAGRFEFVSGNSTNLVRCVTAKDLVFEQATGTEVYRIAANGVATWSNVGGVAGTAMTLNSTGLGIGVTPSAWWSSTKALQFGLGGSISGRTDTGARSYFASNAFLNSSPAWTYVTTNFATRYEQNDGTHQWFTAPSGTAGNAITFTQAMTLDAVSNLHVGTTAYVGTGNGLLQAKNGFNIVPDNTGNAGNRNWNFAANGSSAGSLDIVVSSANNTFPNFAYRMQLTSAGAAYNTTGTWGTISDSRLKENISDARNYLADLLKLRVVKYSLKEEKSVVATKLGLIAQEVEQVFPSLVEQSDVAYDGGDGIRTVKTSILVPMLLKAIQELTARVQTLETR